MYDEKTRCLCRDVLLLQFYLFSLTSLSMAGVRGHCRVLWYEGRRRQAVKCDGSVLYCVKRLSGDSHWATWHACIQTYGYGLGSCGPTRVTRLQQSFRSLDSYFGLFFYCDGTELTRPCGPCPTRVRDVRGPGPWLKTLCDVSVSHLMRWGHTFFFWHIDIAHHCLWFPYGHVVFQGWKKKTCAIVFGSVGFVAANIAHT